ncbi:hypothetical protein BO224_04600 [Erysipelotrichaceae bacterium NYU-BL-E8]|uniref:Uncharacterized protein n=1 Tax=Ileibacterium valens TaxID=1862668 RepID=A0A1U7NEE7_9FIRM|nr:hypothetical protein BM735_13065 [Erysipelotrichaceae bacterium NYU-BL-F16]OLU37933.1 hypothetical protein BO222_09495 [Ileibacterium valens]OLU41021.1 hypothetical protein BO224_04600 [Erysipelotrichaceae bacterium NYU-BL-E8]
MNQAKALKGAVKFRLIFHQRDLQLLFLCFLSDSILFYDVFFRSSQFLNALKRAKTQKDCL